MSSQETSRIYNLSNLASKDFTPQGFNDELLTEFKTLLQNSEQFSGKIITISKPYNINDNHFELQIIYNIWCPFRKKNGESMVKCQIYRNGKIVNPIHGLY